MEGKKLEEVMGRSLFDLRPNIDDYGLIPTMKKYGNRQPCVFRNQDIPG
ncbi:MAG: hypothetical protein U5K27_12485 [Desulfotignum sp.]|nr:hypothetical protein [Desulfotignum sp.]